MLFSCASPLRAVATSHHGRRIQIVTHLPCRAHPRPWPPYRCQSAPDKNVHSLKTASPDPTPKHRPLPRCRLSLPPPPTHKPSPASRAKLRPRGLGRLYRQSFPALIALARRAHSRAGSCRAAPELLRDRGCGGFQSARSVETLGEEGELAVAYEPIWAIGAQEPAGGRVRA